MDSAAHLLDEIQDRLNRLVSDHGAKLATALVTFKDGAQVELNDATQGEATNDDAG